MEWLNRALSTYEEGAAELSEYAALAAASELVTNWNAALRDGTSLDDLLKDINDVHSKLDNFRSLVIQSAIDANIPIATN